MNENFFRDTIESALADLIGGHKHDWARLTAEAARTVHGYPFAPGGTTWVQEQAVVAAVCGHLKPKVAVESGVLRGESLRAARLLHSPARHLAFDIDPLAAGACPEGIELYLTDWRNIGDVWPEGLKWDFALIDSEHTAEAVEGQLDLLGPHAADGAVVVVCHDCDPDISNLTDGLGFERWMGKHYANGWRSMILDTPVGLGVACLKK